MALIPKQGHCGYVDQSLIALCWLRSLQHLTHSCISKFSGKKISGRFVDWFDEDPNVVYQFHGCYYHGCKKCFDKQGFNSTVEETFYN